MTRLEEIKRRAWAAHHEINALAQGKRKWTMSIPAQDTDSDLVLQAPLDELHKMVAEIRKLQSETHHAKDKAWQMECDKTEMQRGLKICEEELQRANEELKNLREWNSDLEEQNGRVAIKNQLLEGKIATLEFDLQRTRGLLEEAAPFARHVAVCENHDGSKFQELAEGWLERASRGES